MKVCLYSQLIIGSLDENNLVHVSIESIINV